MNHSFVTKRLTLVMACVLISGSPASGADPGREPQETAYLRDHYEAVVLGGYRQCWHTGTGPAPAAMPPCDSSVASVPTAYVDALPSRPADAAPAIVAVTQPVAVVLAERVTLNTDALFDFDTAVLRPAGRESLDAFASKVRSLDAPTVTAIGHADRFGSARYNQHLSEARAYAVRTYLIGLGIEGRRIHAEGRGETQPITQRGDCRGSDRSVVRACLQPDRRVDIDVVGNRSPM